MPEGTLTTPGRTLKAYWAVPPVPGPWPGVVVLHDMLGMSGDTQRHAKWLAAAGYLALAPDLYSYDSRPRCLRAMFHDLLAREGPTFDDIDAARQALANRPDCTGKIGVIGFCAGGGFALLSAARPGYAAASVNYGKVPEDVAALLQGACPVVASYGRRDPLIKGAAPRLQQALAAAGVAHDVKEYPEASHAFLDHHKGLLGWLVNRTGMRFHEPSALDAQRRILAFFDRYLGADQAA